MIVQRYNYFGIGLTTNCYNALISRKTKKRENENTLFIDDASPLYESLAWMRRAVTQKHKQQQRRRKLENQTNSKKRKAQEAELLLTWLKHLGVMVDE